MRNENIQRFLQMVTKWLVLTFDSLRVRYFPFYFFFFSVAAMTETDTGTDTCVLEGFGVILEKSKRVGVGI